MILHINSTKSQGSTAASFNLQEISIKIMFGIREEMFIK